MSANRNALGALEVLPEVASRYTNDTGVLVKFVDGTHTRANGDRDALLERARKMRRAAEVLELLATEDEPLVGRRQAALAGELGAVAA